MAKDKRAADQLNVALAGVASCITVARNMLPKDSPAQDTLGTAITYVDDARDALITIQFHGSKI